MNDSSWLRASKLKYAESYSHVTEVKLLSIMLIKQVSKKGNS